jgi:glucan 1,3-beta-glucosidase
MSSWTLLCYGVLLLSLFDWSARWPRIWNVLLILLLISMTYINLGLVFDARYRDFPSAFVLLPVMLVLLNGTQQARIVVTGEGLLLGSWLVISSLLIAVLERISNGSALLWCALCALLGGRVLFDYWLSNGRSVRPNTARQ